MKRRGATTDTAPHSRGAGTGLRVRRLTCVYGPGKEAGASWNPSGGELTIGRVNGRARLQFDDARISRRHAELVHEPHVDAVLIRDLGSKNGTYLNGARIRSEHLMGGSVLRIGDTLFVYEELDTTPGLAGRLGGSGRSMGRALAEAFVDLAAPSGAHMLIQGPTGAGKELLAGRAHRASGRPGRLVAVNCATFNRELVGSELFGHVRGAFSGARAPRKGLFQDADRGTLFLDEIAELQPDMQAALLRAVQDGHIRPVGSDRELRVDVRVVAATHQDLAARTRSGKFREDLLARLSGASVTLPGLEDRRVEILPLMQEFLGTDAPPLDPDAAEALLLHDWPHNVREIQQVSRSAMLLAEGMDELDLSLLPERFRQRLQPGAARVRKEFGVTIAAGERPPPDHIRRLLIEHGGNVAAIVRTTGWHREQLYRWMRAAGIDPAAFRKQKRG